MEQVLFSGFSQGALYGLVGLGFGLIYFSTRIFHLAHGAVYVTAAYSALLSVTLWGWSLAWGAVFAVLVGAALGVLMELVVYRPLSERGSSPAVLLLASLGLYTVGANLLAHAAGPEARVVRPSSAWLWTAFGVIVKDIQIAQVVTTLIVSAALWFVLRSTLAGWQLRALSENAGLSTVLGVNAKKVRIFAFAGGSGIAGVAGYFRGMEFGVDPHMGFDAVLGGAVASIVGGAGSFLAPLAGGLILGMSRAATGWLVGAKWETAATFLLLLSFLLWRPSGLFARPLRSEDVR